MGVRKVNSLRIYTLQCTRTRAHSQGEGTFVVPTTKLLSDYGPNPSALTTSSTYRDLLTVHTFIFPVDFNHSE